MKRLRRSIRTGDFQSGSRFNSTDEDMSVDLHGMTCAEGEDKVLELIEKGESNDRILIIHGKGSGRMKNHIRRLLLDHEDIKTLYLGEKENFPGKEGVCVAVIR